MTLGEFRRHCAAKPGATEDFPFDETTLTFRVGGKIFALTNLNSSPFAVNLKCDPDYAVELRERFSGVLPGWHQNKRHWNTVTDDGSITDILIFNLADHSYNLVFNSLPSAKRAEILS